MNQSISIIGAGIGGLTTAIALRRKGIPVAVYEGSAVIKPVGAGILLANNAMQVYRELGLYQKVAKAGNEISCIRITDQSLKEISAVNLQRYEAKYQVCNVAIHRGELQQILASEFGMEHIFLAKRLTKIEKQNGYSLTFDDGSVVQTDVVIGADGLKSVVRSQLFSENTFRHAGQHCWRGVCDFDLPEQYARELNEAWGKGVRFGFVKISQQRVYWFALTKSNAVADSKAALLDKFKGFHPVVCEILEATSADQIVEGDIMDLKPIRRWQDGHACLIGDAAHATTPNLGQGACQAIEDAHIIGKLIGQKLTMPEVFQQYEQLRKKKAHLVVNSSWMMGKMAQVEHPFLVWLRNGLLRATPEWVNQRQMDVIFKV